MKQYIMGMITGTSLLACIFMFMGASDGKYGRYQAFSAGENKYLINTGTGDMYISKSVGTDYYSTIKWVKISAKTKFLFVNNE